MVYIKRPTVDIISSKHVMTKVCCADRLSNGEENPMFTTIEN